MILWLQAVSDLFINLSAGWFGAALIVPLYTKKPKFKPWVLTINLLLGIVALLLAIFLRNLI